MVPTAALKAMAEEVGVQSTQAATADEAATDQTTDTSSASSATADSDTTSDTSSSTDASSSQTTAATPAAPTTTATQEALPAAPGEATSDTGVRTMSTQDAIPGKHATSVTASQAGLTLKTEAAWVDATHADDNYNATDTLTVSGIAAAKQALADASTPAADSKVTVSEVIAGDWSIDTDSLEASIATEKVELATEGIDESYVIDWVTYQDDGTLKSVDEGTENSYARITYTLDFAKANVDTTSVSLPLTLAESARGIIDAYEAIANDTSAAYTNTADGDGTLYTGGTTATLGATTVTATSPELQVTAAAETAAAAEPEAATTEAAPEADSALAPTVTAQSEEPATLLPQSLPAGSGSAQSTVGGQAYVTSLKYTNVIDGTQVWDNDDNAGDDSGPSNGIVRSFDDIIYKTSYTIATADGVTSLSKGTVHVKTVLPCTSDVATFDTSSMTWLSNYTVTEANGQ